MRHFSGFTRDRECSTGDEAVHTGRGRSQCASAWYLWRVLRSFVLGLRPQRSMFAVQLAVSFIRRMSFDASAVVEVSETAEMAACVE